MKSTTTVLGEALIPDVDAVAALRALIPARRLSRTEARSVAERQAVLLLDLWNVSEPPVPQFVITGLPGIYVDWLREWPRGGITLKRPTYWQIVLNRADIRQRQRFSLAHEFKHILDDCGHPPEANAHVQCEACCNYFAACLLMPRPWVKHDYYGGIQRVSTLAKRYFVSKEAMTTRLSELGLTATPRRFKKTA